MLFEDSCGFANYLKTTFFEGLLNDEVRSRRPAAGPAVWRTLECEMDPDEALR